MKPFALALVLIFALAPAAFADAPDRESVDLAELQSERAANLATATPTPQGRTFWGQMADAWKVRNGFVPSYAEVAPGIPNHAYVSSTPVQGNDRRVDLGAGQTMTPNAYGPGVHMNQYGQPVQVAPAFGGHQVIGRQNITPNAYGPGIHMNQYGQPVRTVPAW